MEREHLGAYSLLDFWPGACRLARGVRLQNRGKASRASAHEPSEQAHR
jgi:hypothetical protein